MKIFRPAFSGIIKLRQSAIENFVLNPKSIQLRVFNELIHGGQYSKYGKKYNFEKINTPKEYRNSVPIITYDELKPYVEDMFEGEQNILWNSSISWFAKSSGTTSDKSKFIPVSKETLDECHFKAGKDVLALYLKMYPESAIFGGKCLVVGGSHQINQLSGESFYGDLSAVMLQNMPWMGQVMRSPDLSIALMDEWEEKIEKMALATMSEDITYIAGVPTWTLVLLKKILELTGAKNIHEVWPNLELYLHGGISFKPYRKQFEEIIQNPNMHYLETYNASEGFFAAQDDLTDNGMLLFLNHGIYFEFLPMEELGKEKPMTISLDEVELNKNYALVISTNSGLYRYMVGDTVKFTSLDPFKIVVSGRTKHFINAFGEELIIDNTDNALQVACTITNSIVNEYTAAPQFIENNGIGYHEWIIEFEKLGVDLETFTDTLDTELKRLNSDYEAKRHKDMALLKPKIHIMQIDGFKEWLKSKNKLGGQNKVPRLSNERNYVEEILPFIK